MPANDSPRRDLTRLAMAGAAMGLFLVGYYWGNQYKRGDPTLPVIQGVMIRPARALPDFELLDSAGHPFTNERFAGQWTLLSLADVSGVRGHLAVTRMIEVHNRMASNPGAQEELLLVLAARRQHPTLAGDFESLSPALFVLSGEPGELRRLRASLGAPAQETLSSSGNEIPLYLIGPAGRLLALFAGGQAPASIASDLDAITAHVNTLFPDRD